MNTQTSWTTFVAARGAFASWLQRKRPGEKQPRDSDLHEWENEGGKLAPVDQCPTPRDPPDRTAAPSHGAIAICVAHGDSFIAGLDRGVQAGMTDARTLARGGAPDS